MDQAAVAPARPLADLPSPPGRLPLVGHAHRIELARMHQALEGWAAELGPAYRLQLGPTQAIVITDTEMLQTVLRERPDRYRRFTPIESVIAEVGANGVFSVEGEAWRPQRKLVMQALASTHFRAFFPAMQAITQRLHHRWERAAATGATVEMTQDLTRYTVDITTALAFGEDPNTLDRQGDAIQQHLALVFPMLMDRINAPFPLWRWLRLPKDRAFDRSLALVKQHIAGLIERARTRMAAHPGQAGNLLESMLLAADAPGSGISTADVAANVLTVLLAGEDTTAHTLAWTMPFLCADPALQDRLHAQALDVLGTEPVCPGFDDLRRLDAFEAAATEATRLKPIVPLLFMEPLQDVELGGLAIPAGTPLFFLLRPAMRDAQNFGRPGDYLPERWAPGHGQVQPHNMRAYAQFGAGPRMCPGRHLAGVELRLVLSMLLRNFRLSLAVPAEEIREVMAFTMMPQKMPVRLQAR